MRNNKWTDIQQQFIIIIIIMAISGKVRGAPREGRHRKGIIIILITDSNTYVEDKIGVLWTEA